MQSPLDIQPITDEYVLSWISQLEQWTNVFYNAPTSQSHDVWQAAQSKLVQFQKVQNPLGLCTKILEKSRSPLVLYQATLCLKNAVANDVQKFDQDKLFELFQFLYQFLSVRALENDMSINETASLTCAMILKKIASEKACLHTKLLSSINRRDMIDTDQDRTTQVINMLCLCIKNSNDGLSKKVAAALLLHSLLLECQLTNRSTALGIRVWKHLNSRKLVELHLKRITEVCLETINEAFSSNVLDPSNQSPETQVIFQLVGLLIRCIELCLSFNSGDSSSIPLGESLIRFMKARVYVNRFTYLGDEDQKIKIYREWSELIMSPNVVKFLFQLYTTIKSMVNRVPGWSWPANMLKHCLNCLYFLSDVHSCVDVGTESYAQFVGNMMFGAAEIMKQEVKGIDDSFQIACFITAISMHTTEQRDTICRLNPDNLLLFLNTAQVFTFHSFTLVATTPTRDEEEEEEKTVDALLDFWYHLLRNIESHIKLCMVSEPPDQPKISMEAMKVYARRIVENYIACHIHKPLGQLVIKTENEDQVIDLEQADDQDDNSVHAQQLISFGLIARFDAIHSAELLINLLSTRVGNLEALLNQYIGTDSTPENLKDWELINDDIHWLLLMTQHFLTQTGFGEVGFMSNEILEASVEFNSPLAGTLRCFETFDHTSPEADPIVRLIIVVLKFCQLELGVCQSNNVSWLSAQTNRTLTSLLSRFCLTYLYPRESEYSIISEAMNYCFGKDAPLADKFLQFVIEHTCCIIMYMKDDAQIVTKNVQLMIQLLMFHANVKDMISKAEAGSMTKLLTSQMRPENLGGFSPGVAKSIIKLATRLFVGEDSWNKLIEFFIEKWNFIMSNVHQKNQSQMVATKFLEFCDFAMGVCEACDDETSQRLLEQLLVPIVKALPTVIEILSDFESTQIAVFELLYNIVNLPMVSVSNWTNAAVKAFYENCHGIIENYAKVAVKKKRGDDEEDCQDILAVLKFCEEVMKRDWGNTNAPCDQVIKLAMEKLIPVIKPEHLQYPTIRAIYYRLLVYLVDEDVRLANLNDNLLNMIVSSVILAIQSQFDKDADSNVYTIISIVCRSIHVAHARSPIADRLGKFVMPILPALFHVTMSQGSFTMSAEAAEMLASPLYSLLCVFPSIYHDLVRDLIQKQDDEYSRSKIKSLFEDLDSKMPKYELSRAACREFNALFVPFMTELHNYITTK